MGKMDVTVQKTHWSPKSLKMFDTKRFSCRFDRDSMRHLIEAKINEWDEGRHSLYQVAGLGSWSRWRKEIRTGVRIEEKKPKLNLGVQSVCCLKDPLHGNKSDVRQGFYIVTFRLFAEFSTFIQSEEESMVSECHKLLAKSTKTFGAELCEEFFVPVGRRS